MLISVICRGGRITSVVGLWLMVWFLFLVSILALMWSLWKCFSNRDCHFLLTPRPTSERGVILP